MYSAPVLPADELPELSVIAPLIAALEVLSRTEPLLAEPDPLITLTRPPVAEEEPPPESTNSPPVPQFPDPTTT